MAHCEAASGRFGALGVLHRLRALAAHVRLTTSICIVLICGSFVSAAIIEMGQDRSRALSQAAEFTRQRAQELALDAGSALDHYQTIAKTFASADTGAETSAALSEAGGPALKNILVLDRGGKLAAEMRGPPQGLLPLNSAILSDARAGQTIVVSGDTSSITILFPSGGRIIAVQIDPRLLLPPAGMGDALLALPSGRLVAQGARWKEAAPASALSLAGLATATRTLKLSDGTRLVSLEHVRRWSLVAGASVRVEEALSAWYGAFPLYLLLILGPSVTGAALAVLFVRVFERQARVAAAAKALRSTRPGEARLLVRLAEAERRAAEAERARDRFVAQVGHELRTPLNAIIGFAEVIEARVFGEPGNEKYVEYARDIGNAGRELHAKIGSVLEYAALNTPDVSDGEPERAAIADAAEIARRRVAERATSAATRGLKLVVAIPDVASVKADPAALARILGHLLDNAIAYTPKGGTVSVDVRVNEREVITCIQDTGAGFSPREKAEAGQAFRRFPRSSAPGGMGVGLAIAMGLSRRIGATLTLSSPPDAGTLAELRLAAHSAYQVISEA